MRQVECQFWAYAVALVRPSRIAAAGQVRRRQSAHVMGVPTLKAAQNPEAAFVVIPDRFLPPKEMIRRRETG